MAANNCIISFFLCYFTHNDGKTSAFLGSIIKEQNVWEKKAIIDIKML